MLKVLKKIYPEPKNSNYENLNYDTEGLYSITHPLDANKISETILKYSNKSSSIIDLTAGCGGNLISFGKYFDIVFGLEIDENRFKILLKNINCYNYNIKIKNDNCINYLDKNFDIYFIDPPWGGPEYKSNNNLKLYLSNIELKDILSKILKKKIVVLKLPYNYNYQYIINNYVILEEQTYNNIKILYIKT